MIGMLKIVKFFNLHKDDYFTTEDNFIMNHASGLIFIIQLCKHSLDIASL